MHSFLLLSLLAGAATLGASPMPWRPSLALTVLLSLVASAFIIAGLDGRLTNGREWTILHIGGFETAFMLAAYGAGRVARWIYLLVR